jgi:hypothetical protein
MPEDHTLVIRVQYTPEDLAHFQQNIGDAASDRRGMAIVAIPVLLSVFVAFVLGPYWLAQVTGPYLLGVIISVFVLAMALAATLKINAYVRQPSAAPDAPIFTPQDFTFSSKGMTVQSTHAKPDLSWRAFQKAKETASHYLLFMDPGLAYLVPKRAFSSAAEAAAFSGLLRQHVKLISAGER